MIIIIFNFENFYVQWLYDAIPLSILGFLYIPKDIFTIADAKRGDIGNTSKMYARAFFEELDFDSVTIAPYMGSDSIRPFLDFEGKWAIVLALTKTADAIAVAFVVLTTAS